REDWNQPRVWSLPSRYMSAWKGNAAPRSSGLRPVTAREEEPESIQTSRVSVDLVAGSGPFQSAGLSAAHNSAAVLSNQTLEPCCSIKSAVLRMIWVLRIGLPWASKKAGMGTPQERW